MFPQSGNKFGELASHASQELHNGVVVDTVYCLEEGKQKREKQVTNKSQMKKKIKYTPVSP